MTDRSRSEAKERETTLPLGAVGGPGLERRHARKALP